jgi:hypothetical protein
MKKIVLAGFSILIGLQLLANPISAYPSPASSVSERLLKTFQESFPNAEKVIWNESSKYYTVSFVEQGILTRIDYEKNGEFAGSARYYSERYLPYYLINVVKKKYPGYKIYGVTEMTASSEILYYIKLEGSKYWLTVALNGEGEGFIQDKYRKAL